MLEPLSSWSYHYSPDGSYPWDLIVGWVKEREYRAIAEIGVVGSRYAGMNARIILQQCAKDLDVFFLVDPITNPDLWEAIYSTPAVFMHMSSAQAAAFISDGSLDLVFIDADHSYDGVAQDIALWTPKVRKGGIISGHDYQLGCFDELIRAVNEAFQQTHHTENTLWWVEV